MNNRIQDLLRRYRGWWIIAACGLGIALYQAQKPAKKSTDHNAPYDFEAQSITPQDLCHRVFTEGEYGYPVRLAFRLPITPTNDPRVWHYHPGVPARNFPAILQIRFVDPPPATMTRYPTIIGTVSGVRPDQFKRPKGHLGVVVITDAHLPLAAARE